jgi:hypothetical protein
MVKKCPPGVFCIENYTFLFFTFLLIIILGFMYIKYSKNIDNNENNYYLKANTNFNNLPIRQDQGIFPKPSYSFSDVEKDVLLNPYSAPLRDNRVFNTANNSPNIPINVPTQSLDTNYRQVGILTRVNGTETILPLMGRPLFSNRDKWNFYTMNDKNNMIKLPITFKNKSCTTDQGCDNIYNGDTVYVEGYGDIFKVTIYDNDVMRYIPYL